MANPFDEKVASAISSFGTRSFAPLNHAINVIPGSSSLLKKKGEPLSLTIFHRDCTTIHTASISKRSFDRSSPLVQRDVCVCVFVTVGHERFSEPSCPSNCSDDVLVSRDRQNERETS